MDVAIAVALAAVAAISAYISYRSYRLTRWLIREQWKRDCLRRLVSYRFHLTEGFLGTHTNGEPFAALNEVWVVFAEHPPVLNALRALHPIYGVPSAIPEGLDVLIREMGKASGISLSHVGAEILEAPFTPQVAPAGTPPRSS